MKNVIKKIIKKIFIVLDILLFPLVFVSALLLGFVRRFGVAAFPACRAALLKAGAMLVIMAYNGHDAGFKKGRPAC
ncbi:MAG TPA: hypothetical protein PKW98_20360, partial [Candidatus Wallbacteria bacterium]|nr:hypothetical protein [Candidatus Wallbacteria bacterium]